MKMNQMVIKSTECFQEAEREKTQKGIRERSERYCNWPRERLGEMAETNADTARQSRTHETASCALGTCPHPLPSPPSHAVFVFLARGPGMMNAQVEIVLEVDFSWQNGCKGCQICSKM